MRVDLKKFLFIGSKGDQAAFFAAAQKAGIAEFINPTGARAPHLSTQAENYIEAIKTLRHYILDKHQDKKKELSHARIICTEVLSLKKKKLEADAALQQTEQEIKRIKPFGDFSIEAIHALEKEMKKKIHFYIAKTSKNMDAQEKDLVLINSLDGIDYFIAIGDDVIQHRDLILEEITESLSTLQKRARELRHEIHTVEGQLKELTRYSWLLHYALTEELNRVGFDFANSSVNVLLDESLFVIEAWVPINRKKELFELTARFNVYTEEVHIEPKDTLPTYLENKGLHKVGEDLVHIFDVPSATDKDPSIWLLSCFALFFAMIVGDAGYGLIFLLVALLMRYKISNLKGLLKRFVTLVTILGVSCILWGAAMSSFFGIKLSDGNPLRRYAPITWLLEKKADYHLERKDDVYQFWIKQVPELAKAKTGEEFMAMSNSMNLPESPEGRFIMNIGMELALMAGCIHIILGLLRYIRKNPIGAGWIAFIIGGYLYVPEYLDGTSILNFACGLDRSKAADVGLYLLGGGLSFSLIAALFFNGLLGIFEIMTSVQIFADILSYLRIFALGLAGSVVSSTTNDLVANMPVVIAVIALIFAHSINILLSIMGGVIHGLRLNFLEWYHYSFEGGGKQFKPLELHTFE